MLFLYLDLHCDQKCVVDVDLMPVFFLSSWCIYAALAIIL